MLFQKDRGKLTTSNPDESYRMVNLRTVSPDYYDRLLSIIEPMYSIEDIGFIQKLPDYDYDRVFITDSRGNHFRFEPYLPLGDIDFELLFDNYKEAIEDVVSILESNGC